MLLLRILLQQVIHYVQLTDMKKQQQISSGAQSMIDNGCTSAVLVSYAADGGMIIDEMNTQGWTGQVYGGDGIAEEGLGAEATSSVIE